MRRSIRFAGAALAMAAGLAACATTPSAPPGQAAKADPPPDPNCVVQSHGHSFRPGDNVPIHMAVRNTGRWCFGGFGFSGVSPQGSRVVDSPAHGEVRLLVREDRILFGFRAHAGYAGSDSFLITMPSGLGDEINLAVTVVVAPAA